MTPPAYKRSESEWHRFFMGLAGHVALLSKDPDRKVGAVLVAPGRRQMSIGYNGFSADVPDAPELLGSKAFKLQHMVHAEDNCLQQAPFSVARGTLYSTRFPCLPCAEKIAASGVVLLVAPKPDFGHLRWGDSWMKAVVRLSEAGVRVQYAEEKPHG